jgi:hypothetical protein
MTSRSTDDAILIGILVGVLAVWAWKSNSKAKKKMPAPLSTQRHAHDDLFGPVAGDACPPAPPGIPQALVRAMHMTRDTDDPIVYDAAARFLSFDRRGWSVPVEYDPEELRRLVQGVLRRVEAAGQGDVALWPAALADAMAKDVDPKGRVFVRIVFSAYEARHNLAVKIVADLIVLPENDEALIASVHLGNRNNTDVPGPEGVDVRSVHSTSLAAHTEPVVSWTIEDMEAAGDSPASRIGSAHTDPS